jgi:signal transduction histidine kinase
MKHSQARTVAVDMRIDSGGDDPRLIVRVADDGVGTLGERPGSRGLANMRNRAAGIGADLQIKATPGAGTEVRLIYGIKGPLTDRTNGSGHSNLDSDAATEQLRVK